MSEGAEKDKRDHSCLNAQTKASWPLQRRLRSTVFIGQDAVDAMHGKRLPLHLGRHLVRYCIVRGIRHHLAFATGPAALLKGTLPIFTTAINARLIMSNLIPEMPNGEDVPYCIWHPDVPSEDTLRRLVLRYPNMKYQVGRTCAIAGYTNLYQSLDVLPEVAIAEEARESGNMEIYEQIVGEPVKWKVFNDYDCLIMPPKPASLNADTRVVEELRRYTQGFREPCGLTLDEEAEFGPEDDDEQLLGSDWLTGDPYGYRVLNANVTGDMLLGGPDTWTQMRRFSPAEAVDDKGGNMSEEMLKLIWNPLPPDLPTMEKNVLITMAAYHGDIDRYSRLRRPYMVGGEHEAVIRGIYHNTLFARWWSAQPPVNAPDGGPIAAAIMARFIMNDDISWALDKGRLRGWPIKLPYLIHFPDMAQASTYEALARLRPEMRQAVAHAAIYADYQDVFDKLLLGEQGLQPTRALYVEAQQSPNAHYRDALERIASQNNNISLDTLAGHGPAPAGEQGWQATSLRRPASFRRRPTLGVAFSSWWGLIRAHSEPGWDDGFYNGAACSAVALERWISLPDEWKPTLRDVEGDEFGEVELDYNEWPTGLRVRAGEARDTE